MKISRKIFTSKIFILSLAVSFFVVSCKKDIINVRKDGETTENASVKSLLGESLSGEQIFREVVLLEKNSSGKNIKQYQSYLDMIDGLTDDQKLQRKKTCDKLVAQIQSIDANYFAHFKTVMVGNDPDLVEKELKNASEIVVYAASLLSVEGPVYNQYRGIANQIGMNYNLTTDAGIEAFRNKVIDEMGGDSEYAGMISSIKASKGKTCLAFVAIVAVAVVGVLVAVVDAIWFKSFINGGTTVDPDLQNDELVVSIMDIY